MIWLRTCSLVFFISAFTIGSQLHNDFVKQPKKAAVQAAKKEQQAKNEQLAKTKLFYNRVGAPSRPNRSIDEMMLFLMTPSALQKGVDFIGYDGSKNMTDDQSKGLDGIIGQEDAKMMLYYQESLKHKVGH